MLVLHSLGRGFEPHASLAAAFRSALSGHRGDGVELHELTLETVLYGGAASEPLLVDYLAAFDSSRHLDLVVTMGGPAAQFVQRNRRRVFASTPLLIAGVDPRMVTPQALTASDAEVAIRIDLAGAFENLFRIVPETTSVLAVIGASPLERFWEGEIRRAFEPFAQRARLTFPDDLPYSEMLKRAAGLPSRSAILYAMYLTDADGVPHPDDAALVAVRSVAKAPVFGLFDSQLGKGIVGGPLISLQEGGRQIASVASRILRGESPARLRPAPLEAGPPVFDWRELDRWKIEPARLPPGSAIRFRPPGFWEVHRWAVLGISGIGGAEALLIAVLLVNLLGRRRAEERLRKSEEQYALAVEGANDGLWDWDVRTEDAYFSPRCKQMLGLDDAELRGRIGSWEERIHPEDRERAMEALRAHLDGKTPAFRVEHRLRHEDGSYRWVLARGKAQRDREGRPYRMAGSLSDVTERKQAEEAVRDVSGRLILAQEEERARLARELHDDVTQRLARLAIDTARAEQGAPDTPAGETMRQVREGLVRLSEDVHALSYRLHPSLLEDLGLADAIRVECDRFGEHSDASIQLRLRDVPERIPPGVAIGLYRIAQEALRNVARHACARSVEVSLQGIEGGVQLAVRDDGVGFDSSGASARRTLGHASMRERIHLLGGEIDIESAPGEGTAVVAWAPLEGRER